MKNTNTKKNSHLLAYFAKRTILKLSVFSIILSVLYTFLVGLFFSDAYVTSSITLVLIFVSNCYLLSSRYSWVEAILWSLLITTLFLPLIILIFSSVLLILITGF